MPGGPGCRYSLYQLLGPGCGSDWGVTTTQAGWGVQQRIKLPNRPDSEIGTSIKT